MDREQGEAEGAEAGAPDSREGAEATDGVGPSERAAAERAVVELRQIAGRLWTRLPGKGERAVPTSEEGLAAMEEALPRLAPLAGADPDLALAIALHARTCVWARRERFVGSWGLIAGAATVVVAALVAGRHDHGPLAIALVWAGSIPLYLHAAVAPQYVVNARILARDPSLDERFLRTVAAGPPMLAPIWLLLRATLLGAAAPLLVLVEASRRARFMPGIAMAIVSAVACLWWATSPATPPAPAQATPPTPTPTPVAFTPGLRLGGTWVAFGAEPPPVLPAGDSIQVRAERAPGGGVGMIVVRERGGIAEPEATWGPPVREEDRSVSACRTVLHDFEREGILLHERASDCGEDGWTVHEFTLR